MLLWKEWEGVKGSGKMAIIMPRLSELTISWCHRLKALPEFLSKTPLQKLHISNSPILQKLYRQGIGEQWTKISHIPTINLKRSLDFSTQDGPPLSGSRDASLQDCSTMDTFEGTEEVKDSKILPVVFASSDAQLSDLFKPSLLLWLDFFEIQLKGWLDFPTYTSHKMVFTYVPLRFSCGAASCSYTILRRNLKTPRGTSERNVTPLSCNFSES
ncbi:hypothetical protein ACLB2K_071483 [Fragaria x ananassa]